MTKKMREILSKIEEKKNLAKSYTEENDYEKADKVLNEVEELQKQFEVEKKLSNLEKEEVTEEKIATVEKKEKATGFQVIAKMLTKKKLSDEEKALVVESDSTIEGSNGTNFLLPEDVKLEIRELRKSYNSAKKLVNVVPTSALSGSQNFEVDDDGELTDFDDGDDIAESDDPKFDRKNFFIKWRGKLIYISNILKGNEKAGLMNYINRWFLKKAVRTENKKIFACLIQDKTPTPVKGLKALKKHINKMDPSTLIDGVIVTNQTGFAEMDDEEDANGRGMLETDPTIKSQKRFQTLPIEVFLDSELPNVNGKAPIIVGSTQAGCDFMEHEDLYFAVSEHYKFNKNQTTLRVIEGFDTVQTDSGAYDYLTFEPKNDESKSDGSKSDKTE